MFDRIKLALAGLVTLLIGGLYGWAKYQQSKADSAIKERDIAQSEADSSQERVDAHVKREEIEQDIAMGGAPYVDAGMRDKYQRD